LPENVNSFIETGGFCGKVATLKGLNVNSFSETGGFRVFGFCGFCTNPEGVNSFSETGGFLVLGFVSFVPTPKG
jgi:hypothetical protein